MNLNGLHKNLIERLVTKQDYFHQPHVLEEGTLAPTSSYYYDLRDRLKWPGTFSIAGLPMNFYNGQSFINPITVAQYGLSHLQYYFDCSEEFYLDKAMKIADALINLGETNNKTNSLYWTYPIPHNSEINWISGMAQGQAASFLFRVGYLSDTPFFLAKAEQALQTFHFPISEGGVKTYLDDNIWFEEYATSSPPFTLNGFIVALLALRDASIFTSNPTWNNLWLEGINTLVQTLPQFCFHSWTYYDLSHTTIGSLKLHNVASPFYHRFHIVLMQILLKLFPNNQSFVQILSQWEKGISNNMIYRAILEKVCFRILKPNSLLIPKSTSK